MCQIDEYYSSSRLSWRAGSSDAESIPKKIAGIPIQKKKAISSSPRRSPHLLSPAHDRAGQAKRTAHRRSSAPSSGIDAIRKAGPQNANEPGAQRGRAHWEWAETRSTAPSAAARSAAAWLRRDNVRHYRWFRSAHRGRGRKGTKRFQTALPARISPRRPRCNELHAELRRKNGSWVHWA